MRYLIRVPSLNISVISEKDVPDTLSDGHDFDYLLIDCTSDKYKAYIIPRGLVIEIEAVEDSDEAQNL